MNVLVTILIAIVTAVLGAAGGYQYRKQASEKKIGRTEEYAKNLLEDAQRKADEKKKQLFKLQESFHTKVSQIPIAGEEEIAKFNKQYDIMPILVINVVLKY